MIGSFENFHTKGGGLQSFPLFCWGLLVFENMKWISIKKY